MDTINEINIMNTLIRAGSIALLDNDDDDANAVYSGITDRILRKTLSYGHHLDYWFIISNKELSALTSSPYYFVEARARLVCDYHFIRYMRPHNYTTIYPCYQIDFDGISSHPDVVKALNRMRIPFFPSDLVRLPFSL